MSDVDKNKMRIIGIDPSMRNLGLVFGVLDLTTLEFDVHRVELTETEKSKSKTVRKSSDDFDRCQLLHEAVKAAQKEADMAFVEMPIGSQNAAAMLSYGACISLIASLDIPVIQCSPREVKEHATGDKLATKEEMIEWATKKFPAANWLKRGDKYLAKNEHLADACGAINAGIKGHEFQALVKMMRRS